jgi:hypothetical protein
MYVVKVMIAGQNMTEDIIDLDTDVQPFDTAPSSMFIYLSSSSFGEDAPS